MMKLFFTFWSLVVFSLTVFCQKKNEIKYAFSDTTLFKIDLIDTSNLSNPVKVVNNNNTIIYISADSIRAITIKRMKTAFWNDDDKKECQQLLYKLDSLENCSDKNLSGFYPFILDHIISEQLLTGKAKVYDKLQRLYLWNLYQRMERVISDAYRWFYFTKTDRRYLFCSHEWWGIIPNELYGETE